MLGGGKYTTSQASYDLARLLAKGIIERLPGRNVYRLTPRPTLRRLLRQTHSRLTYRRLLCLDLAKVCPA
jgi:hypothetical protein